MRSRFVISTIHDDYIRDYIEQNACWVVTLNDGTTVYQDDGRYEPYSAWIRLYQHCAKTKSYITHMRIGFRDNIKQLPPNQEGYFFCKMARGCFGMEQTMQLFLVGYLKSDLLYLTKWKTPEMLDDGCETRDTSKAGECLIRRLK